MDTKINPDRVVFVEGKEEETRELVKAITCHKCKKVAVEDRNPMTCNKCTGVTCSAC
jgi:hypothetical protein